MKLNGMSQTGLQYAGALQDAIVSCCDSCSLPNHGLGVFVTTVVSVYNASD